MRKLTALLSLALLSCASAPDAPRSPRSEQRAPQYLVKSYNVEWSRHADPTVIEAVGAGGADIVCLQETTPKFEPVLRERYATQYPHQLYQHNRPRTGATGLAVLSRYPLVDRGHHSSPYGWHPAWHVEVETPSGPVQILHVHLRAKLSGRSNDLAALLTLRGDHLDEIAHYMRFTAPDKPTLVVGDFNEEPDGAAIRFLERRGFQNALPRFRPEQHTWRHPLLAWELRQTLDHILFDRGFEVVDARVLDAGRSDHLPLVARLEVSARDPRWAAPLTVPR